MPREQAGANPFWIFSVPRPIVRLAALTRGSVLAPAAPFADSIDPLLASRARSARDTTVCSGWNGVLQFAPPGSRFRGAARATRRQQDALAAYVSAGGSVPRAATLVGIRPSTVKRHLADLRMRFDLTTEQLIYRGRAEGWLVVPELESVDRHVAWPRRDWFDQVHDALAYVRPARR